MEKLFVGKTRFLSHNNVAWLNDAMANGLEEVLGGAFEKKESDI